MLGAALKDAKGKKIYGYLKEASKKLMDEIVDALASLPEVAECYDVWNRLRDDAESYYKGKPGERLPLSQQKEFRAIKNMVVREAENVRLGVVTFEDEQTVDEGWEDAEDSLSFQSLWQMAAVYRGAREVLRDEDAAWFETEDAPHLGTALESRLHSGGAPDGQVLAGRTWRDAGRREGRGMVSPLR